MTFPFNPRLELAVPRLCAHGHAGVSYFSGPAPAWHTGRPRPHPVPSPAQRPRPLPDELGLFRVRSTAPRFRFTGRGLGRPRGGGGSLKAHALPTLAVPWLWLASPLQGGRVRGERNAARQGSLFRASSSWQVQVSPGRAGLGCCAQPVLRGAHPGSARTWLARSKEHRRTAPPNCQYN